MSAEPASEWRMNVAAIITDDSGRVLLGCPPKGAYRHFPQGGIKRRESARDAIHREIAEEVGLASCRVLAEFSGLRYAYRSKNKKSARWRGQQQTYFLLHCPGEAPAADCSGSAEFASAVWLPPEMLVPELFVPFKREVIAQALAHFFPGGKPLPLPGLLARCTTQLYRYTPGMPLPPLTGTPLFGGGKQEALYHFAHLPVLKLHKKARRLIILSGMEGAGIKKCLRHIASRLDPLSTRYHLFPADLSASLPAPGELSFLVLKPDAAQAPALAELEQQAAAEGDDAVQVIKLGLHLSRAKQESRLKHKELGSLPPWREQKARFLAFLSASSSRIPWHLLPADHAWYRDFLLFQFTHNH